MAAATRAQETRRCNRNIEAYVTHDSLLLFLRVLCITEGDAFTTIMLEDGWRGRGINVLARTVRSRKEPYL